MTQRFWFGAAWVLLVFIVALGFWVQSRVFDRLDKQQEAIVIIVNAVEEQQKLNVIAICDITYKLHPEETDKITRVFADNGINCPGE